MQKIKKRIHNEFKFKKLLYDYKNSKPYQEKNWPTESNSSSSRTIYDFQRFGKTSKNFSNNIDFMSNYFTIPSYANEANETIFNKPKTHLKFMKTNKSSSTIRSLMPPINKKLALISTQNNLNTDRNYNAKLLPGTEFERRPK